MTLAPVLAAPPIAHDFAGLMARFAPFERRPEVAVAVSGGGDSMALLLLAHEWAQGCGGRVTGLTVDHGFRPEAAAEAAQVASWCGARGIAHAILRRAGPVPASGLQAAARAARYRLLEAWCRDRGVLHLLIAHQRADQAETVDIRHRSGSGIDGLAGMPSLGERGAVRLLRPLLGVARGELRDFLRAQGQDWIEDPSNRNPAFARVRSRAALGQASPGSTIAYLGATGTRLGRARAAREAEDAACLARWLTLHPAGFAWLDPQAFAEPDRLGMKALGAILATVSGSEHPPRRERVERLQAELARGLARGRTLGGCLILPRRGRILVCREPAAVAAPIWVAPGGQVRWDRRFQVALDRSAPAGFWVGALGPDAAAVARELGKTALAGVPAAARDALPALRDAKGVVAVPSLGYFECYLREAMAAACRLQFRPNRPLTGAGFTIV